MSFDRKVADTVMLANNGIEEPLKMKSNYKIILFKLSFVCFSNHFAAKYIFTAIKPPITDSLWYKSLVYKSDP